MQVPLCGTRRFKGFIPKQLLEAISSARGITIDPEKFDGSTEKLAKRADGMSKDQLTKLLALPFTKEAAKNLKLTPHELAPQADASRIAIASRVKSFELLFREAGRLEEIASMEGDETKMNETVERLLESRVKRSKEGTLSRFQSALHRENQLLTQRRVELQAVDELKTEHTRRVKESQRKRAEEAKEKARKQHQKLLEAKARRELIKLEAIDGSLRKIEEKERMREAVVKENEKKRKEALERQHQRFERQKVMLEQAKEEFRLQKERLWRQSQEKERTAEEQRENVLKFQEAQRQERIKEREIRVALVEKTKLHERLANRCLEKKHEETDEKLRRLREAEARVLAENRNKQRLMLIEKHRFSAEVPRERDMMPGPGAYKVKSSLDLDRGFVFNQYNVPSEFDQNIFRARELPGPADYGPDDIKATVPGASFSRSESTWLEQCVGPSYDVE